MNHEELKDSIAAYSIGALDEEEASLLEKHLNEGCPECESLLREMQSVSVGLAYSAPAQEPPLELKSRIVGAIQEKSPTAKPAAAKGKPGVEDRAMQWLQKSRARWRFASLGLAVAAGFLIVFFWRHTQDLTDEIQTLQSQREISAELVKQLRSQLASKEEYIEILKAPKVRLVELQGLEPAPESQATVIWDPDENRAAFFASNLPVPAPDKDYQLWMLRGDQPVDAGVFSVTSEGQAEFSLQTIADSVNLAAFAVTLEPKGGAPQPTGQMYLLGAINES